MKITLAIVLLIISISIFASTETVPVANEYQAEFSRASTITDPFKNREIILTVLVLMFGSIILIIEFLLLTKYQAKTSANDIVKILILTTIIIGTLFLISAGWNNDQIAPAMGLFGTIAGYLLGRTSKDSQDEN